MKSISSYLNLTMRLEYGVQKPWYFIFTEPFHWIRKRMSKSMPNKELEAGDNVSSVEQFIALDQIAN
jgi:hypothetical protein